MTLIEVLVVLAILGVAAGTVGVAWRSPVPDRGWRTRAESTTAAARAAAIAAGRSVAFVVETPAGNAEGVAFPDGSVVADTTFAPDRLTGLPTGLSTRTPSGTGSRDTERTTAQDALGGRGAATSDSGALHATR